MDQQLTPMDIFFRDNLFWIVMGCVILLVTFMKWRSNVYVARMANDAPEIEEQPIVKKAVHTPAPERTPVQQNYLQQFNPASQPPMHPSMPVVTQGATLPQETIVFQLRQTKHNIRPEERQHTFIGTNTGGGKTQASLAMMLNDMNHGAAVYWLNPQYTLYHPVDQPTDLRGLDIIAIDDINEIERCLLAALELGEQRKPLYQAGLYVGENVVLYLDETPAIVGLNENIPPLIKRVLLELRKMNIWIVLAAQGAQLSDLKLNATAKGCFISKFVKNLDQHSWRSLFTAKQPEIKAQRGDWFTDDDMGGIVIEHIPLGHPLMGKGYVHTDPLGMRVPQSAAVSSSAGTPKPADRAATKTGSVDPSEWLSQAILSADEPVQLVSENDGLAAPTEEKPRYKPLDLNQFEHELDKAIAALLYCGIKKNAIVRQMQWPDGLKSKPYQLKRIDAVIEKMTA